MIECASGGTNAIGIAEEITVTARTLADAATMVKQVGDTIAFTMMAANSHLCYTSGVSGLAAARPVPVPAAAHTAAVGEVPAFTV